MMMSQFGPISHLMSRENLKPMPMWGAVLAGFLGATGAVWFLNDYLSLGGYDAYGQPYVENYGATISFIHIVVWVFVAWLFLRYGNGGFVSVPLEQDAPHATSMARAHPGAEPGPAGYKGDATSGFGNPTSRGRAAHRDGFCEVEGSVFLSGIYQICPLCEGPL